MGNSLRPVKSISDQKTELVHTIISMQNIRGPVWPGNEVDTPPDKSVILGCELDIARFRENKGLAQRYMSQRWTTHGDNIDTWNLLHLAAFLGHRQAVEALLNVNANSFAFTDKKETPLMKAIEGHYFRERQAADLQGGGEKANAGEVCVLILNQAKQQRYHGSLYDYILRCVTQPFYDARGNLPTKDVRTNKFFYERLGIGRYVCFSEEGMTAISLKHWRRGEGGSWDTTYSTQARRGLLRDWAGMVVGEVLKDAKYEVQVYGYKPCPGVSTSTNTIIQFEASYFQEKTFSKYELDLMQQSYHARKERSLFQI